MARRKGHRKHHRKHHRRGGASQRAKFGKVARACWSKLRAGELPRRGDFGKCMKRGL